MYDNILIIVQIKLSRIYETFFNCAYKCAYIFSFSKMLYRMVVVVVVLVCGIDKVKYIWLEVSSNSSN